MYNVIFVTSDKKLDFLKLTDGQLNLLEYLQEEGYLNPSVVFECVSDDKFSKV